MATCNSDDSVDLLVGLYKGKKLIIKQGLSEKQSSSQPNVSVLNETVEVVLEDKTDT